MKAQLKFSNMHLFFPKVIAVIILILGVALIIQRARACKKTGTPSSVCTGFDGHPMARRGEGERALKIGITASLLGGLISLLVLALLTPPLAKAAIKFSAVEKFLIILFAMTVIAALSKGSMTKGVFAGFLGVLISLIGELTMNNKMRMVPSFLKMELRSGFQLLPVLIGLFAIAQMFQEAETGMKSNNLDESVDVANARKFNFFKDFKGQTVNVIRSALLGTLMGILLMCIVGAYAIRSGVMFDVWSLLIFGIVAYIFARIKLPSAPFLIGFILGGDLEKYFIDTVQGNDYTLRAFFTRPIALVIWVLIIFFLGYAIWDNAKGKKMEKAGMKD